MFEKMLDTKGYYDYIQSCMEKFKDKMNREYEFKEKERDRHEQDIKDNIAKVEERYN